MSELSSNVLTLDVVVEHSSRVIAVPSEKLECEAVDLKGIVCGDDKYKVYSFWSHRKGASHLPKGLFRMATGTTVDADKIWNKYPDSHTIYLFLCEKL